MENTDPTSSLPTLNLIVRHFKYSQINSKLKYVIDFYTLSVTFNRHYVLPCAHFFLLSLRL